MVTEIYLPLSQLNGDWKVTFSFYFQWMVAFRHVLLTVF